MQVNIANNPFKSSTNGYGEAENHFDLLLWSKRVPKSTCSSVIGVNHISSKKNENKIRKQAKNNTRVALLSESNKITSMSSDSQRFALVLITK